MFALVRLNYGEYKNMDWFIAPTSFIVPYMLLLLMDKPIFVYSRKISCCL